MYFYFTVYPDVTSHCSFFHTFVPLTQTLPPFRCGGRLLSHQLIDDTKTLKQKSSCTSASNFVNIKFSSDPRGKKLQFVYIK